VPVAVWVRADAPDAARALATLVASELATRGLGPFAVEAETPAAAELIARERGARSLLRIGVSLEHGLLRARGDLVGTWVNFWSGAAATRPAQPAAAIEASVEADAHALALLTRPATREGGSTELRLVAATFAKLPRWTAALTAGDLDGDGRDEVIALTDDELLAFSPDGRLLARRAHRSLPNALSPSREPFGAVQVLPSPARIAYLSAQRARGEQVALDPHGGFRVLDTMENAPVGRTAGASIWARLVPGQNQFAETLRSTDPDSGELKLPGRPVTLSTFSGPSGAELLAVFPSGRGILQRGLFAKTPPLSLEGLGAASALVDVDGDGTSELVTTEPVFAPSPERVRVLASPGDGALDLRTSNELPRGRALQVVGADLDGDGTQEVIVAVWLPDGTGELLILRRGR